MEIFKSIKGFPHYWIGDHGTVLSTKSHKKRILKPGDSGKGYKFVILTNPQGKKIKCYVHKLVSEAFLGQRPSEDYEVDHLDRNRANNRLSNLQYLTGQENLEKAHNKAVICIETGDIYPSAKKASRAIGKSDDAVACSIWHNCRCAGYTWRYVE